MITMEIPILSEMMEESNRVAIESLTKIVKKLEDGDE